MSEVWKKIDGINWDMEEEKSEIDRLKRERVVPVQPIELEPVLNEHAY